MKINSIILFCFVLLSACAGVKTRKQAAEAAKNRSAAESTATMVGPMDEDDDTPVSGVQAPIDDPVLDDELAAMGIDPSKNAKAHTPEPVLPKPAHPVKKKKTKKK